MCDCEGVEILASTIRLISIVPELRYLVVLDNRLVALVAITWSIVDVRTSTVDVRYIN
jgi:hypothetical protein